MIQMLYDIKNWLVVFILSETSGSFELKLAALYSGGKDSTFSIFRVKQLGHEVVSLE